MAPTLTNVLHCLRQLAARPDTAPDAELLDRFVRLRDQEAFTALLARHGPMVWGGCRRALHDRGAAEAAFKASFLVLPRKATSFDRAQDLCVAAVGVIRRVAAEMR